MAQVSELPTAEDHLQSRIDHYLDYELSAWRSVPEYASQWSEMDAADRETFHLHWRGVTEAYLDALERWANAGQLNAAQLAEYGQLHELIAQNRPAIEALLAS
jgi:hypothetical protein